MPIALCVISPQLTAGHRDPVAMWSAAAGVDAGLMTINFVVADWQVGARYDVMATLQLPTAWSGPQASKIQLALASALSACFSVPANRVQVVTQRIESGDAVENGEEQHW